MTEVKVDLRYLFEDKDRHGNKRLYVRRYGRKVRLRVPPTAAEFGAAYADAITYLESKTANPRGTPDFMPARKGSLGWLAVQYFKSEEFKALNQRSQARRREIIESCLREPTKPGARLIMRDCPYRIIDASHIQMLRDRKAGKPGAANNRRKYLSSMFGWAIEQKKLGITANPCRDVRRVKYATTGFYTWTMEDFEKYVARHPVGTKAYLAMALMVYLGARRGDMVKLGQRMVRDGVITYTPAKTAHLNRLPSSKPILPPLAKAIAATTIGLQTFLVTDYGLPYSDAGIGNKMREWCDQADLPLCTAHGLKKLGATLCADAGATDRQLMALFDWTSERQANTYTLAANRTKLAHEAAHLLGAALSDPLFEK